MYNLYLYYLFHRIKFRIRFYVFQQEDLWHNKESCKERCLHQETGTSVQGVRIFVLELIELSSINITSWYRRRDFMQKEILRRVKIIR